MEEISNRRACCDGVALLSATDGIRMKHGKGIYWSGLEKIRGGAAFGITTCVYARFRRMNPIF